MKKNVKVMCFVLALMLALSLSACGGGKAEPAPAPTEAPAAEPTAAPAAAATFENGGLKLTVPAEFAGLVDMDLADGDMLFSVTEKASAEAAAALHPDNTQGAGWLFGISRVSEEQVHEMMCEDMSGRAVFARDDSGNYYILNTPTDVRIEPQGQITDADMELWGALNGWASGMVPESFAADNSLTPCRYGNTEPEIFLSRIAWGGDTDYVLAGLEYGTLPPGEVDGAPFAEEILNGTVLHYTDEQGPDGEYLVLRRTDGSERYDFFLGGDGSWVRRVTDDFESLYRCDPAFNMTEVVSRWIRAVAESAGPYDHAVYQSAMNSVLDEYASLTQEVLENYDDAAHPELPWYTGIVANTMRSSLYYGFKDFDGNGVPELVIAAGTDDYRQPVAIYAFDGQKMVYLCKDHPLGERCFLSGLKDGVFVVRGSGSAATGVFALYRIGEDGFSTDMLEVMDYEYQNESTVTYTPELGNMTAEEFIAGGYPEMMNEDLAVEYTLFAAQNN